MGKEKGKGGKGKGGEEGAGTPNEVWRMEGGREGEWWMDR